MDAMNLFSRHVWLFVYMGDMFAGIEEEGLYICSECVCRAAMRPTSLHSRHEASPPPLLLLSLKSSPGYPFAFSRFPKLNRKIDSMLQFFKTYI